MSTAISTDASSKTSSMNGRPAENEKAGDKVDVKVDMQETIGIVILGVMFFFILMAMLRSQRRERKLLEKIADLQASSKSKL